MRGRRRWAAILFGVVTVLLLGRAAVSAEPGTVGDFLADPGKRERQLEACANDPGGIGRGRLCANARAATWGAVAEKLRRRRAPVARAPLPLPPPAPPPPPPTPTRGGLAI